MPTLADRIAVVLDAGGPLWFPGLAGVLAADLAAAPGQGWVKDRYGTRRWLSGDAHGPANDGRVRLGWGDTIVEPADPSLIARYSGLQFASLDVTAALPCLGEALVLLASLDGLEALLGALVRSIHLLQAPPGYDVSHSDPEVPFSIFVSIPEAEANDTVPRLAESILHEASHLQLSLVERHLPLVRDPAMSGYSPWKGQTRPLGGLIHGLYVFAVIHQALTILATRLPALAAYACRRRREIGEEVRALGRLPAGLTLAGETLWRHSMDQVTKG